MTPRAPATALLLLGGVALGPDGLAVLTPSVLAFLDPAAPVALAILGVLAGLSLRRGRSSLRILAASQGQAVLTALVVAAGVWLVNPPPLDSQLPWWVVSVVLALSAATSCSVSADTDDALRPPARRLDLHDCLLTILAGSVALGVVRAQAPDVTFSLIAQGAAIAMLIALSGWLFLSDADAPEERVFTFGSLLLLGGAADYVSASALFAGFVAGICWRAAGGSVQAHVGGAIAYLQHSLVVLILVVAGARADFPHVTWMLTVIYVLTRVAGKLTGGWLAVKTLRGIPEEARLRLVSPGIFGIGFALNATRIGGPEFVPVLTVVVVGAIAASLIESLAIRAPVELP